MFGEQLGEVTAWWWGRDGGGHGSGQRDGGGVWSSGQRDSGDVMELGTAADGVMVWT